MVEKGTEFDMEQDFSDDELYVGESSEEEEEEEEAGRAPQSLEWDHGL